MDQSKKTMRHFYCRDVLWETFEQMANDFDCSIDYLINEAMRYYARSKNYQSPSMSTSGVGMPGPAPAGSPPPQVPPQTQPPRRAAPTTSPPQVPPPARRPAPSAAPAHAQAGGHMGQMGQPARAHPPTPGGPGGYVAPQHQGYAQQAPMPPAQAAAASMLYLIYNGQRYGVNKDQFIIGRGSKTSDLPIKDGNISRKHAAVIRRNGTYYIKDLGSTNGIDYKGMRIDNKRIDEGDVFHLCDYEIRFTYRPD